ncbi:MAG: NERD domain-containing protein/DEAD/DEAH box helicase, partial [Planctomycetaceae bacterium]
AEADFFLWLRDALDDGYTVIHSLPWLASDQRGLSEGECDFLVLHPRFGLLSIEAKGGAIRFDGKLGKWFRENKTIQDPVKQARKSMYYLNRVLRNGVPGWRNADPPFGHAVSFPHADHIPGAKQDMPPEIVLLRSDRTRLKLRIPAILALNREPIDELDAMIMDAVVDELAPEFHLVTNLSGRLDDESEALCRMTTQQIEFMSRNLDQRRLLVEGCAGSGKTMLAIESARRLDRDGARVLMLCYNIPLAEWLKELVAERGIAADVFHFHGLCRQIVEQAGLEFNEPSPDERGDAVAEFWDNEAPALMDQALANEPDRYDAIIVDEGQDFCWHWWNPIEHLLRDPKSSHLSIFHDPRQDLFERADGEKSDFPGDMHELRLSVNCRCTTRINRMLDGLAGESGTAGFSGSPEGVDPERILVEDEAAEREAIRKLLHRLVQEERIDPSRIVILGTRQFQNTALVENPKFGTVSVVARERDAGPGEVRYATVFRFKGLEADCVILMGFADHGTDDEKQRKQLYVAASRAKLRLFQLIRRDRETPGEVTLPPPVVPVEMRESPGSE